MRPERVTTKSPLAEGDSATQRTEGSPSANGSDATELRQMATGIITYVENGKEHRWSIGCMAWETAEHLKKHLAVWKPKAQFVSGEIIPDKHPNDQAET